VHPGCSSFPIVFLFIGAVAGNDHGFSTLVAGQDASEAEEGNVGSQ